MTAEKTLISKGDFLIYYVVSVYFCAGFYGVKFLKHCLNVIFQQKKYNLCILLTNRATSIS